MDECRMSFALRALGTDLNCLLEYAGGPTPFQTSIAEPAAIVDSQPRGAR